MGEALAERELPDAVQPPDVLGSVSECAGHIGRRYPAGSRGAHHRTVNLTLRSTEQSAHGDHEAHCFRR
jgi:hypothetical protein